MKHFFNRDVVVVRIFPGACPSHLGHLTCRHSCPGSPASPFLYWRVPFMLHCCGCGPGSFPLVTGVLRFERRGCLWRRSTRCAGSSLRGLLTRQAKTLNSECTSLPHCNLFCVFFTIKAILGILCNELPVQAFVAVTQKVAGTRGPSFEACPLHQLVSGSRGLSSTSRPDEKALCLLWQLVETLGAIKGETETVRAPWAGLWRPGEDPLSTGAFLFLFLSYSLVWEISSLCLLKNISTRSHETFLVNLHV
uniref:uncharacterized protein LOC118544127 isoform X1 n=1 Tax=Halichoerus grypus TaxID=9711 RepID=UPI001658D9BE|nr:uncharacterized protein LOC118544127 isoform X1 [Halichoerus grypus]